MDDKRVKVVINEQHSLLPDQMRAMKDEFPDNWQIDLYPVPKEGWTLAQMNIVAAELRWETVVFVSPIPALMVILAGGKGGVDRIYAMHNDKREAKEIRQPDGSVRVIHVVAKEGWVLV